MTTMVPMLALLAFPPSGPDTRFDAFMKAHPTFTAVVDVAQGRSSLRTTIWIERPAKRLRFEAKGAGTDFGLSSTEKGYFEVNRVQRVYDEHEPLGRLTHYGSRISGAMGAFPNFLLAGSTKAVFQDLKVTANARGDELSATFETERGKGQIHMGIDAQGRPVRYEIESPMGHIIWTLVSFSDMKGGLAATYRPLPMGYVPYALPEIPFPLAIGSAFPLRGWRQGNRSVDLSTAKGLLVAVLGSDCPPSASVRPSLARLEKQVPVAIVGPNGLSDPSGALLKKLSPPGTPMFYLVDRSGKVSKLWFGFDAQKAKDWEADVVASVK